MSNTTTQFLFIAGLGMLTAAFVYYRLWFERTGRVPAVIAQAERTNLLEAIEEAATEPQMRITLTDFWRGSGWTRRERAYVLRPLIEQRILHIPYSSEQPQRFLEQLWYDVLAQPPARVVLNSRDWTRMATDRSGREPSIIIGRISGGHNQIGGTGNTMTQQELATDQLATLVAGLRQDAGVSAEVRHAALDAAQGIEDGVEDGRFSTVTHWVKNAAALAESSAGAMEATRKALNALGIS